LGIVPEWEPMIANFKRRLLGLIHWLGGTDLLLLLALLVLTAGLLAFLLLVDLVQGGRTQSMDESIMLWMRPPGSTPSPMLNEVLRDLTALGGVVLLTLVTLSVVGYLIIDRKLHAAGLVAAATLGGLALSTVLKHLIDRPRPTVVELLSAAITSSFPSGHSMMAAVVYFTLAALLCRSLRQRRMKLYVLSIAGLVTLLVGVSRVYVGVHYPTDVLAGWSAGLAWAVICWLLARWLQRHGAIEKAD
jgi:undecaprenyl-diphosphatase